MRCAHKDTVKPRLLPCRLLLSCLLVVIAPLSSPTISAEERDPVILTAPEEGEAQIQIVEGEDRMVYEYRQNGVLTMIKVVPDKGRAYYMVPADGAPHYESLDHKRKLYPQWVIVEW